MGKTYINAVKYEVTMAFTIDGVVEKHDIVGAVFGQSEGLLGEDLDLRELQSNGKIGRIEIVQKMFGGKTSGDLIIPSSMDMVETCILSAAIETVDKVGPYGSSFHTVKIEDTRTSKRKQITRRAKELLQRLMHEHVPETAALAKEVREEVRANEVMEYGVEKLPAGPAINESDSLIVVEGRADVINLLKNNIKNVIGMRGGNIPQTIVDLGKSKSISLFVDGDRGGELILRKLRTVTNVDFVARAPPGKEVEELVRKEIIMALRRKIPLTGKPRPVLSPEETFGEETSVIPSTEVDEPLQEPMSSVEPMEPMTEPSESSFAEDESFAEPMPSASVSPEPFIEDTSAASLFDEEEGQGFQKPHAIAPAESTSGSHLDVLARLKGSLKAEFLDANGTTLKSMDVRNLLRELKNTEGAVTLVFDGIVTKRLAEAAEKAEITLLVGVKRAKFRDPRKTKIVTME